MDIRQRILNEIEDAVSQMLYYDRKEDEDLPVGAIDKAVRDGVMTEGEIVAAFSYALGQGLTR